MISWTNLAVDCLLIMISFYPRFNCIVEDNKQNVNVDRFMCVNGTGEIFLEYRCDGISQCADGSDEMDCQCPKGRFRSSAGYCVPSLIYFVQHRYCQSTRNKRICPEPCDPGDFRCSSDSCINKRYLCDGVPHCPYSIDEWYGCSSRNAKIRKHGCARDELPCYLQGSSSTVIRCAKYYEQCFLFHECEIAGCGDLVCPDRQWPCFDAMCVNNSLLDNGRWNCFGGVDETPNAIIWKDGGTPKLPPSFLISSNTGLYIQYMILVVLVAAIGIQAYLFKAQRPIFHQTVSEPNKSKRRRSSPKPDQRNEKKSAVDRAVNYS